jgi:hypothetical protein
MALRLVLKDNSAENLQKAAEYAKRAQIFPLSQVNNPPTCYIDLYDKKVNLVSRLDADMYRTLDAMIQIERVEERDLVAMGDAPFTRHRERQAFRAERQDGCDV